MEPIVADRFFSRDISWLFFNDRVLMEAAAGDVPLLERLKFLSIYSSNLDEFYRVRIPLLLARRKLEAVPESNKADETAGAESEFQLSREIISGQQEKFGRLLREDLLPKLAGLAVRLIYDEPLPAILEQEAEDFFYSRIAPWLQPVTVSASTSFFPVSNQLYLLFTFTSADPAVVNIPADQSTRFFSVQKDGIRYVAFIDDLIRARTNILFPGKTVSGCHAFKITRDADLNLEDELSDTLAEDIERLLANRDGGIASRLLYQAGIPLRDLQFLASLCAIPLSAALEGGRYHNLKDLANLPVTAPGGRYPNQPFLMPVLATGKSIFDAIATEDIVLHPPYHSYEPVLRFFSEAAIDPGVSEVYVTLYRIAGDSRIAQSLITAARNGKQVQVFMELKARFDEANNLRWAKKMKAAGVKVIYSIPTLKVHAKMALVKKVTDGRSRYFSLLSTGNLNESTARFYTDHVLLTAEKEMSREIEMLFLFLSRRKRPDDNRIIPFARLLVAQFNLQERFLSLIDREIRNAKAGLPCGIRIKLNNLEEPVMIAKLYEASRAGVRVELMVRSICCLIPGVAGMSENISVHRIVGRYLEHGRIFWFSNRGKGDLYLGSADWMNRNIHTRIEVCFPVLDDRIRQEIIQILEWQWQDRSDAVSIDAQGRNVPLTPDGSDPGPKAQHRIYEFLETGPDGPVYPA